MKLTIIGVDGSITVEEHQTEVKLEQLQKLVGGRIQHVPHYTKYEGRRCGAWVNEKGFWLDLPQNRVATDLWLDQLGDGPFRYHPILYGTLVIVQKSSV